MISTEPCEVWHPPVQMDEMLSASWLNGYYWTVWGVAPASSDGRNIKGKLA